jgi:hypothetical protein
MVISAMGAGNLIRDLSMRDLSTRVYPGALVRERGSDRDLGFGDFHGIAGGVTDEQIVLAWG